MVADTDAAYPVVGGRPCMTQFSALAGALDAHRSTLSSSAHCGDFEAWFFRPSLAWSAGCSRVSVPTRASGLLSAAYRGNRILTITWRTHDTRLLGRR